MEGFRSRDTTSSKPGDNRTAPVPRLLALRLIYGIARTERRHLTELSTRNSYAQRDWCRDQFGKDSDVLIAPDDNGICSRLACYTHLQYKEKASRGHFANFRLTVNSLGAWSR